MKKYRFRLESVLRVRRIQEEVARGAMARAAAEVVAADAALAASRHHLAELVARPLPGDLPGWQLRRDLVLAGASEVAGSAAGLEAARLAHRQRQEELAGARRRVRALERLDERRRAEHAVEAARQDDRTVDDLVTSRWGQR